MDQLDDLTAVHAAVADAYDVRLFTVLGLEEDTVTRLYSDNEAAYPVGGRKSLSRDISPEWTRICIDSRRVFLGLTPDDVRRVFADHELIARLGCGAIANVPVLDGETLLGTLCILTPEGGLTTDDTDDLTTLGTRSLKAMRAALITRSES